MTLDDATDVDLSKLWEILEDRGPWRAARGCRVRHDLASEQQTNNPLLATRKDAGFFSFIQ